MLTVFLGAGVRVFRHHSMAASMPVCTFSACQCVQVGAGVSGCVCARTLVRVCACACVCMSVRVCARVATSALSALISPTAPRAGVSLLVFALLLLLL